MARPKETLRGHNLGGLGLGVLLALAGCVEHWAKPGGTRAELDFAKASCEAESYTRFPVAPQQIMTSPGRWLPPETQCWTTNGKTQCRTIGGQWLPPTFRMIDLNDNARDSARVACLYRNGWVLADDEKAAAAITRSGMPPPSPSQPPADRN
jgi:hypothetical protein